MKAFGGVWLTIRDDTVGCITFVITIRELVIVVHHHRWKYFRLGICNIIPIQFPSPRHRVLVAKPQARLLIVSKSDSLTSISHRELAGVKGSEGLLVYLVAALRQYLGGGTDEIRAPQTLCPAPGSLAAANHAALRSPINISKNLVNPILLRRKHVAVHFARRKGDFRRGGWWEVNVKMNPVTHQPVLCFLSCRLSLKYIECCGESCAEWELAGTRRARWGCERSACGGIGVSQGGGKGGGC